MSVEHDLRRTTIRHELVFNPQRFNELNIPVSVAGVGAGGSAACLHLAKLGIKDITICDPDMVTIENVGPSLYGPKHVGHPKVEACSDIVHQLSGIQVKARACRIEELGPLEGVVFICVHSMQVRKDILFNQCVPADGTESFMLRVFEGRMSAHLALSHSIDPLVEAHRENWMRYWFPDAQVLPALQGCGATPVSVGPTATIAGSLMVRQFIEWWAHANDEVPRASNQVRFDLETYTSEVQYW